MNDKTTCYATYRRKQQHATKLDQYKNYSFYATGVPRLYESRNVCKNYNFGSVLSR